MGSESFVIIVLSPSNEGARLHHTAITKLEAKCHCKITGCCASRQLLYTAGINGVLSTATTTSSAQRFDETDVTHQHLHTLIGYYRDDVDYSESPAVLNPVTTANRAGHGRWWLCIISKAAPLKSVVDLASLQRRRLPHLPAFTEIVSVSTLSPAPNPGTRLRFHACPCRCRVRSHLFATMILKKKGPAYRLLFGGGVRSTSLVVGETGRLSMFRLRTSSLSDLRLWRISIDISSKIEHA